MVQEATSQSMSYELVCHNLLEILLIKILRHQHFDLEVGKQSKATKDISFIKHYLETYYHESIQLEDLASMTHLSRFYISHSFKKEIGMSPMEYLIDIRIKESKILLRTTNYSISQVQILLVSRLQRISQNNSVRAREFRQRIIGNNSKELNHD